MVRTSSAQTITSASVNRLCVENALCWVFVRPRNYSPSLSYWLFPNFYTLYLKENALHAWLMNVNESFLILCSELRYKNWLYKPIRIECNISIFRKSWESDPARLFWSNPEFNLKGMSPTGTRAKVNTSGSDAVSPSGTISTCTIDLISRAIHVDYWKWIVTVRLILFIERSINLPIKWIDLI